jgi:G3E family GTPase
MSARVKQPIPVTVLTGFLGAGKTTLLNHLLQRNHGRRCAIIINEFGPINIDRELVVEVDEEIIQLNNGCLCCRVRGDLLKSLANLFKEQRRFDYLLVETTGLADPAPVAQTFLMPEVARTLRLDSIVTVVDARHIERELEMAPEAAAQVGFADVILLNKIDLVEVAALDRLEVRLRAMNRLARFHRTERASIDIAQILDVHARDLPSIPGVYCHGLETAAAPAVRGLEARQEGQMGHDLRSGVWPEKQRHDEPDHGQNREPERDRSHHHHHPNDRVKSFALTEDRPLELRRTEAWLSELLTNRGASIYRCKGILYIHGEAKRVVFQGVHMMFEAQPDRLWRPGETCRSQMVFIGCDLDQTEIEAGLRNCAVG